MDYRNKKVIFKRAEEAAYDLARAEIAERNGRIEESIKHKRDAGEAISQSLEFALKHHLNLKMSAREKGFFKIDRQNIPTLIGQYIDESGRDSNYFYDTVDDTIEPSVDFEFLRTNKNAITNSAKHEGQEPDLQIQKKYFNQLITFIREYIDNNIRLKSIADFENVDLGNWDLFYASCDRFSEDERNYILILGRGSENIKQYLKNLSIPKWDLVIDFDVESKNSGFFNLGYSGKDIAPHEIKASDNVSSNTFSTYSQSHYHYFANNYSGSGQIITNNFAEWNRNFGRNAEQLIASFANVFQMQKTIVVVLFPSRREVNFLCEKIDQFFGPSASFIFANDPSNELAQVVDDFKGIAINIAIPEISKGIANFSSNFGSENPNAGQYSLPFLSSSETKDVTGVLTPEQFAKLEEDFEVLHLELPNKDNNIEDRREFLSGEKRVSWFGLKENFDVRRQTFNKRYVKPIEKQIENGRGKIFLQHDAGFGGSTIARRIAWEIHDEYPTLILKKYRDNKVKEQIIQLHQKTRKTIFIIMEVPQAITLDEVNSLYRSIPLARPVVFLIVKRGKPSTNDLTVADWGNDVSDLIKVYTPYLNEYSDEQIQKKKLKALEQIPLSTESYQKTPFYIGLITFEEKFFAIRDYISNFVVEVQNKIEQKKVLLYLSLVNDYLGQGLPSSFFTSIFSVDRKRNDIFVLENFFNKDSSIVDSLLVSRQEGKQKFWNIRHTFLAKELKKQILSGSSANPEIWKQSLSDFCIKFIEDSISSGTSSDYTEEVLQKLFIGNRKDRAGEDFTAIINDIPNIDDKEAVFIALKNAYPKNPHYCSHLARFYAYNNKNREKALKYANEAIELSEISGLQDPLLYHIKGMCLRSIAYDLIEEQIKAKQRGKPDDPEAYDDVIYKYVPLAEAEFKKSREIAHKQNRIDGHGYVAHIQLLIRAIDFGIIISGKSKAAFLTENKEPFNDWLDLAESLLEDVKGMNQENDESGKIEECENDIQALYENYELVLQNLRNQLDKSKNPSRTRRQIVRTYIRGKKDYSKDARIVNNILQYMELNIENEPDNEKNFFLWFQTARYSYVTLDDALNKLAKWKAHSSTVDAVYYLYILKVFKALEGYTDAAIDAYSLIKECKIKGKTNIAIYEWYGKGLGLKRLVNRNSISADTKEGKLEFVTGYFTSYFHDGSGIITIVDKLEVFFSPTQAKLTSNELNKKVKFYLGFSYDGLRADSTSVQIMNE